MKRCVLISILLLSSFVAGAQKFSAAVNVIDLANFGTLNADLGIAVSQHLSIVAGAKVNPWDFSNSKEQIYSKNLVAFGGVRIWPWYVYSGMWIQVKGQYADYKITGTWRPALDQGKAVGAGAAIGYTFMVSKHVNIEIGAGGWGGYLLEHNVYCCTDCMKLREKDSGPRAFIDFDSICASFVFVF